MKKNKVSVLVPSYNHELFVTRTIESVINQTYGYENIELIVLDDYSTDNTGKILEELSAKYNFLFIQHKENKGVTFGLNKLLSLASGKYIATCSSDDYWHPEKLSYQVQNLEALGDDYGVCHTDAFVINENNKILFFQEKGLDFNGVIIPKILIENGIVAPSVMFRKAVFDTVGFFDEKIPFEDREMWIRIGLRYKFSHIKKRLVYRRLHDSNLSRINNKDLSYFTFSYIFNKYKDYYREYNLIKRYHYFMFNYISTDRFFRSLWHMTKSGNLVFNKRTFFALIKLFIPRFVFRLGLEKRLKRLIAKW